MKKTIKIISTILIVMMLVTTVANIAFALSPSDIKGDSNADTTDITSIGNKVMALIQTFGIVLSVIIIAFLGVKYMVGSPEEKGEYKKSMLPYLIGAILIFSASTIANGIYKLATSTSK